MCRSGFRRIRSAGTVGATESVAQAAEPANRCQHPPGGRIEEGLPAAPCVLWRSAEYGCWVAVVDLGPQLADALLTALALKIAGVHGGHQGGDAPLAFLDLLVARWIVRAPSRWPGSRPRSGPAPRPCDAPLGFPRRADDHRILGAGEVHQLLGATVGQRTRHDATAQAVEESAEACGQVPFSACAPNNQRSGSGRSSPSPRTPSPLECRKAKWRCVAASSSHSRHTPKSSLRALMSWNSTTPRRPTGRHV